MEGALHIGALLPLSEGGGLSQRDAVLMAADDATAEGPLKFAVVVADSRPAIGMAIDDTEIFATSCGLNGVWRVSRSGGELVTLVEDTFCPFGVALDDQNIYFPDRVVHEDRSTQMGVFRIPRSGGTPELVTHTDGISFAVLDGYVYTVRDGFLVRARADGSSVTELSPAAPRVDGVPASVAVDDRFAYWTEPDESGALVLRSIPLPDA